MPHRGIRILGIALIVPILFASVLAARRHAGYTGNNMEEWGVSAKIYTINPNVLYSTLVEWVSVVLSYDGPYWVQLGYAKRPIVGRSYYRETENANYYSRTFFGSPSAGSWHTYQVKPSGYESWACYIDGSYKGGWVNVEPFAADDLQALVETFASYIRIDGSEFKYLKYYNMNNGNWYSWYQHWSYADPPYWVEQLGHTWFKAWGGG